MGASGWTCYTPYDEDLNRALHTLQQQVLSDGGFYDPHKAYPALFGGGPYVPPATVDEARRRGMEDGTHSIMDMLRVGDSDAFGVVRVLPPDRRRELFGTARPSRAEVEPHLSTLLKSLRRWRGICVPLYEEGRPAELLFVGASGD
jgi:hypothetical protein